MSFPEDQRRNGVKNADVICNLPNEKVLGIPWEFPKDSFNFNIQVNRRPLKKKKNVIYHYVHSNHSDLKSNFCWREGNWVKPNATRMCSGMIL